MDFDLSQEQAAVRDLCRDFAREVVAPAAEELDRENRFGYDIVRQMGELGLFGLPFRAVCLGAAPIHDFGTEEQKQALLPDLLAGRKLWAFGLTEPHAGSDAGATKTRAERRNGEWVINGAKQFITNCGTDISAGVTITAVTGKGKGGDRGAQNGDDAEISAILVSNGTNGYHVLPSYRKLGWHSSDTHPLSFEDCRVPEANLLGTRGGGYRQFLHTLMGGRIAIAALSVGVAQACLDASLAYAKERHAFGAPISKQQAIQFKLADMAMETELARTMVYRAATAYHHGTGETSDEVRMLAAMAKLYASETSKRAADQAVQIHGGYGFMEDYPVARYWRDVKINEIGEGTSEVQRMLIARLLGL
jgi:butyryl-CoA dehydrogenase